MQSSSGTGLGLAFLTTAIGATVAGPVHAALVSTAPAGFTPVTVTSNAGSTYSFDLDANGSNDFTLTSQGGGITITAIDGQTSGSQNFFGSLFGSTDSSSLTIGSLKQNAGPISINQDSFGLGTTRFSALGTNLAFQPSMNDFGNFAASGTLGYLEGVLVDNGTFRLLDYGLVDPAAAVPEPASLALLATGAAGIAALRRRRAAQAAAQAA